MLLLIKIRFRFDIYIKQIYMIRTIRPHIAIKKEYPFFMEYPFINNFKYRIVKNIFFSCSKKFLCLLF